MERIEERKRDLDRRFRAFLDRLAPGTVVATHRPIGSEASPALLDAAALSAGARLALPHVVDRASPEELTAEGVDGRASAISTASWNLFANIGLAPLLEPFACPIERRFDMHLINCACRRAA